MCKSLIALAILISLFSCNDQAKEAATTTNSPITSQEELIKRGKYLTTIGACHDCHSPKLMTDHGPILDTTRLLSGHPMNDAIPAIAKTKDWVLFSADLTAYVGPWGVSYSANLTPHETGIGNWDFEQFKTAITKGKSKGLMNNRPLLPPMPWEMYKNMTDEDLHAVFAYLKSLPPINNTVPAPIPPSNPDPLASK